MNDQPILRETHVLTKISRAQMPLQFELEQRFEAIPAENNLKQCMFVMQMQHGQ